MKKTVRGIVKGVIPNKVICRKLGRRAGSSVLLTFDDGPNPETTLEVLDILEQYQAKALFFVVGKRVVEKGGNVLKKILAGGHDIGNHTYSHPDAECTTIREYRREIKTCQRIIQEETGKRATTFRPPKGRVTVGNYVAARSLGLPVVAWSCGGGEYSHMQGCTAEEIAGKLVDTIERRDIVLLHDDYHETANVLKLILPQLCRKGFDLGTGISYLPRMVSLK